MASVSEEEIQTAKKQLPIEPIPIKPADSFKHTEDPNQPIYTPPKPMSHSPKISPSSIPNPNPSVISTKPTEPGYSTVGGYPFSIPGYSAFQPVTHPVIAQSSSSSTQQASASSKIIKPQADYDSYTSIPADISTASAAALPVPSTSCTQVSILATRESLPSKSLMATFSSASPITTTVSMGSTPQITPVLSTPPDSSLVLEQPLSSLMSQSQSIESMPTMSLEQPPAPILRMSLAQSMPTVPMASTISTDPSTSTSMPTISSKSSTHRVPSQHSHISSEIVMQRMALDHSASPIPPISSNGCLQRIPAEHSTQSISLPSDLNHRRMPVVTSSTVPSPPITQRTTSTIPSMLRIPIENSILPNTSLESSTSQNVSLMSTIPSESTLLNHSNSSLPTISLETPMQRTMQAAPNVLLESSKQQIPLEHSMPVMPNMPSDSSMPRMPMEYYMPSLPMMPSELLMRRMQFLQYMQSLQTMTPESSIALMPHMPPYAMSMPQAQSTTTVQTTSIEHSTPITSTMPIDSTSSHKISLLTTISLPSVSAAPMQSVSSMSTKTELITSSMPLSSLALPNSTLSSLPQPQSLVSVPLESMQQTTALTSEQSLASTAQVQQTSTSSTTLNPSISSMQYIQSVESLSSMSNNLDQLKPHMSTVQSMPLLSAIVSDKSLTSSQRMQIVQSVPSTVDMASDTCAQLESKKSKLINGQSLVQGIPSMSTKTSEPSITSITQMPLVQSMPYELAKSSNTLLQRTSLEQPVEATSSLAPFSSVSSIAVGQSLTLVSSTDKSITNIHVVKPLQSIRVTQSSLIIPSENSVQTLSYMQASLPLDSTVQRMRFVRPVQSPLSMESDKLHTQTTILSESSTVQKPVIKPIQSVPFTPPKLSMASIPHGHTSMLRLNSPQTFPSISSISSMPSLTPMSHMPLMQTMPQLSTTLSNTSLESIQRINLQHIPFMSITPSECSPVITKELIPPLSLIQSMSSMTLAPSMPIMESNSMVDSTPSVSDPLQIMSSEPFIRAKHSEISAAYTPPASTAPLSHLDETVIQREVLNDNRDEPIKKQTNTNVEECITSEITLTTPLSEGFESPKPSLTQRVQEATIEAPLQTITKEIKRKPLERFSLKTSIPISKIDIKSVSNTSDISHQNPLVKKLALNALKINNGSRVEKQIQRNILIRTARMETEGSEYQSNINDKQFRNLEPKIECKETNLTGSLIENISSSRTVIPNIKEPSKLGLKTSSSDISASDKNNQIVFIQNKNCTNNKKMILTIQQQNPQVLLKRKNIEKNPLRFTNQVKKCKEESVTITEHIPSKVVALKRLHQGDGDEDDFENLITENQIYGNKIVVKEKIQGTSQEQDLKLKNSKSNRSINSETKNIVKPPNFVYLSKVKYPTNIMMYKNNLKANIGFNKYSKVTLSENKIIETNMTSKTGESIIKSVKLQNVPISKESHVFNTSSKLLQITSNRNSKTDMVMPKINKKVLMDPKIVQHVPVKIVDTNKQKKESVINLQPMQQNFNTELKKPIDNNIIFDKVVSNTSYTAESISQPKTIITETMTNTPTKVEEEVSSLDIYEKRKRLRRIKYLLNRSVKDVQKSDTKKPPSNGRYIITPEKIKAEIYKEFASTRIIIEDDEGDLESEYEDELEEYESLIESFRPTQEVDSGKMEFLSNFMLGSHDTCKEILWNKRERIIQRDKIASAYIAAGRLDRLMNEDTPTEIGIPPTTTNPIVFIPLNHGILNDNGSTFQMKQMFLSHLKLKYVKPHQRAGYETTWQEILKERKRRDAPGESNHIFKQPRVQLEKVEINTKCELKILTEIKNSVTENNNLIKKRLDLSCQDEGDSIKILAEKNFSELDRLSKMADRSVKHFSGQDTRKRDLNPGFDSANIQNLPPKIGSPINFPNINIPSISKIISLKTTSEPYTATSTQATSMDEPQNSAAGVDEMFSEANIDKTKEVGCQTENAAWPGIEEMIKMYRDFDKARKREMIELTRRNTALKVEGAHITRNTSRHSDRARALLAERRNLSLEEGAMKQAIQRLFNAVDVVRNYF